MTEHQDFLGRVGMSVADGVALAGVGAAFWDWVPHVASLVSAIWLGFRIYESWLSIRLKRRQLKVEGGSKDGKSDTDKL